MKWDEFFKVDYLEELDKFFLWKTNRWLGLRSSYIFYHLGFSANLLSVFRCLLVIVGFYIISLISADIKYVSIVGVFILTWQVHLNFSDGAIARIQCTSNFMVV